MDLQYVRDYVRDYLDLTSEDLSDRLIDRWAAEGTRVVGRSARRFPHYRDTVFLDLVEGQTEYEVALKDVLAADCVDVGPLAYMDDAEAEALFWRQGTPLTGKPQVFSRWGVVFRVWPQPDADYRLVIRGYRVPTDLLTDDDGATAVPDVPTDFHECVLEWVMHKAYLHEDDPELAAVHKTTFDELLSRLMADEVGDQSAGPVIFGGGPRRRRLRADPVFGELLGPGLGSNWGQGG